MKTRRKIYGELSWRYQKTKKKSKAKILDEYVPPLEYNWDYLTHLLLNWGKTQYARSGGKSCRQTAYKRPQQRSKRHKTGRP